MTRKLKHPKLTNELRESIYQEAVTYFTVGASLSRNTHMPFHDTRCLEQLDFAIVAERSLIGE